MNPVWVDVCARLLERMFSLDWLEKA
jgi:hypothetical protein